MIDSPVFLWVFVPAVLIGAFTVLGLIFNWRIRFTLVDQWWTVLKGKSVNYVVLLMNTVIAYPLVFIAVLPFAPLYIQLPVAVLIAVVASSPVWAASITAQPKLQAKIEEKKNAENAPNSQE